jgi:hypothetical protein
MIVIRSTLLVVSLLAASAGARADVIHRRGTEPPLEGEIVRIDDNGVVLRSGLGASHEVPWDRVRAVEADRADLRLEQLLPTADDLWRARSRVQRHDTMLAEPLFERLWPQYIGRTNETALIVAEGLLRCRLARSAYADAVIPALEVARLRRAGVRTDRYSTLREVLDDELSLCPSVAPAWPPSRALAKLPADLEAFDAGGDEVVAALASLYRSAVLAQIGVTPAARPADLPDHPGVAMLDALLACAAPDRDESTIARVQLLRRLDVLPGWAGGWIRHAVGLAFLAEEDVESTQEGLWHLSFLPARFAATQPLLAELALARMADALRGLGDEEAAAAMDAERRRLMAR